jgi:hypothetical protein
VCYCARNSEAKLLGEVEQKVRKRLPIRRVLLVPGFCEPRFLLLPLKLALSRQDRTAEIWHDNLICRSLERSVDRLRATISKHNERDGALGIVTHSFGDWVVRQAIAGLPQHSIEAMVSLTPVVASNHIGTLLRGVVGHRISEVSVMADAILAGENIVLDPSIRRLMVWAAFDWWVKKAEMPVSDNLDVQHCLATHLSVVIQPNVHRLIRDFFDLVPANASETIVDINGYSADAWQPAISRSTKHLDASYGGEGHGETVLVNRVDRLPAHCTSLGRHFEVPR